MNDARTEYKAIILSMSRVATLGGGMSLALEDFIIDFVNEIVDSLSDDQFDYLLEHKKIPVSVIQGQEEYDRISNRIIQAAELLESGKLLESEYSTVMGYYDILTELIVESREESYYEN